MSSFGLHVRASTVVDKYLDGVLIGDGSVPSASGTYIAIATASNGGTCRPHVGRLEVRDAPGGTLLFADDFADLSAWSTGWSPTGIPWTISPAGFAYNAGTGSTIYRPQPSGAFYIEAQGVTFDGTVTNGWVQLMLNRTSPHAAPDNAFSDGYRVLFLAPGDPQAGQVAIVGGVAIDGGWGVGMVRMGAN